MKYPTVEHAYQAAKSLDAQKRALILDMPTPTMARTAGRRLGILREDWHAAKVEVMLDLLNQKFAAGSHLSVQLDATGDIYLEEGNPWGDRFWGTYRGTGQNMLGQLLMQIRRENRADEFTPLLG